MSKNTKSNTIRIIAGQWRGRRLPVLKYSGLRPTTDRVRETLFNWLMHDISGSKCLDVFAGTGVLGLECLSRGAEFVQFIESNSLAVNSIERSSEAFNSNKTSDSLLINADAISVLHKTSVLKFDIVFLDPPFNEGLIELSASLLEENSWLSDQAIIYVEWDVNRPEIKLPSNWVRFKSDKVGQSAYSLYRREVYE